MSSMDDLAKIIEQQGEAFEAFKDAHTTQLKEIKSGQEDYVTKDTVKRIDDALNDAAETQQKLNATLEAERKEREDLELRLQKARAAAPNADQFDKEFKAFNLELKAEEKAGQAEAREIDADGFREYKAAFSRFLRKDERLLTADEHKAMSVGSDPSGGYLVTPDMSGRIASAIYETSPMRQISSVTTISTDALEGIEDTDEAASGWVDELASRTVTDTPDVGRWRIPIHETYAMPKTSQKLLDDAGVDVEAWLSGKVADKLARTENTAFVAGTGVGQPRGFTTYTTAADSGTGVTWGKIGHVVSGASADFAGSNPADKIYDLVGTLKAGYAAGAQWVTRRTVVTKIRQFKDGSGAYLWQPSMQAGVPDRLVGYPIFMAEDMPALAASSLSLAFGNFAEAYQIVDRMGIRVLRDPYTDKPNIRFYTTKRTGGAVVNFEAIKVMKFST